MKYLQTINEKVSKVYEENLKFITSNSGYDELQSIVPDLATDVCDEFEKAKFETHAFVYLKYKRATKSQSTNIGLNFLIKSKTLSQSEKKFLADFLAKCEHAQTMFLRYTLTIEIGDVDADKITTELQSLAEQLKSYGYTAKHTTEVYSDYEIKDFETYVRGRCESMKRWIESGKPYMDKYYIIIQDNIDIDLFKPGSDYLSILPNNIISDFKEFCDRFKMNSGDIEQLAELIKKAKEE